MEAVGAAVCGRSGYLELRRANGMLGNLTGDERVVTPSVSLDAAALMFGVPDIVVVDVEGFEMQVLAGATRLLEEAPPSWLVEFHSEPLFHLVHGALAGARVRAGGDPASALRGGVGPVAGPRVDQGDPPMTQPADLCAVCHAREREGESLCGVCRARGERLLAGGWPDVLVSGSGPWDGPPLPRPAKRFPGAASHDG